MPKWLRRTLVVAAVLAALFLLQRWLFAPEPIEVETYTVARGPVEETITNSRAGTVRARRRALISPEAGGRVVEIPFREGESVEAGAVLLQLDDQAERAQLDLANGDLEAATAERERACLLAERAARELSRSERLADDKILAADRLDQIESNKRAADAACRSAVANVTRARAAIGVAQTALEKRTLRAPFGGLVAEVTAEVGEWVTPSPPAMPVPAILDLLDPTSLYVSAPMDEVDAGRIRRDQPARVTVDSHRQQPLSGAVSRIAPYVQDDLEQNRTVEIEVDLNLEGMQLALLPGTSADVEIILDVREETLRIPTGTLMDGETVLVLESETLAERTVTPGLSNWDFTEVVDGLQPGDEVVTSLDSADVQAGASARAAP